LTLPIGLGGEGKGGEGGLVHALRWTGGDKAEDEAGAVVPVFSSLVIASWGSSGGIVKGKGECG
jgi:hypothetical protein